MTEFSSLHRAPSLINFQKKKLYYYKEEKSFVGKIISRNIYSYQTNIDSYRIHTVGMKFCYWILPCLVKLNRDQCIYLD